MVLVRKSRLSVQVVEEETWGVIEEMAEKGGWDEADLKKEKAKAKRRVAEESFKDDKVNSKSKKRRKEEVQDAGDG
jgi:hypothetical protein